MTALNVTVDDSSPLISYSPAKAWEDSSGNQTSSYSQSTFHATSGQGATASFSFTGTSVWLFGGRNATYGPYSLTVDGRTVADSNAGSQQSQFQTLLGGVSDLELGPHTVVLTNTGGDSGVDLDFLVFETRIGAAGSHISNVTVDDSSSDISYGPSPSDWNIKNSASFINNTLHYSQTGGARASYSFFGDAVAVFGTVSPDHANMSISVDGKTRTIAASTSASMLHPKSLLFWSDDLGSKQHTLEFIGNPEQAGQASTGKFADLDAIQVFSASGSSSTGASNNDGAGAAVGTSTGKNSNPPLSKAEVDKSIKTREAITVGAVVGGVLVMFGVIAYLLFLRRRRKLKKARAALAKMPLTPALPMQTAPRSMSPTDAEKGYGPGNAPLPTWHAVAPERRNSVASTASSRTDSIKSVSSTAPLFIKPRRSVELARPPSATMGRSTSSRSSTLDQLGDTSSRTSRPVRDSVRSVKGRPLIVTPSQRDSFASTVENSSRVVSQTTAPLRPMRPPTLSLSPINELPPAPFSDQGSNAHLSMSGGRGSRGPERASATSGAWLAIPSAGAPPTLQPGGSHPKTPYSPGFYDLYEAR